VQKWTKVFTSDWPDRRCRPSSSPFEVWTAPVHELLHKKKAGPNWTISFKPATVKILITRQNSWRWTYQEEDVELSDKLSLLMNELDQLKRRLIDCRPRPTLGGKFTRKCVAKQDTLAEGNESLVQQNHGRTSQTVYRGVRDGEKSGQRDLGTIDSVCLRWETYVLICRNLTFFQIFKIKTQWRSLFTISNNSTATTTERLKTAKRWLWWATSVNMMSRGNRASHIRWISWKLNRIREPIRSKRLCATRTTDVEVKIESAAKVLSKLKTLWDKFNREAATEMHGFSSN
jgi:hypothetical protein